MPTTKKTLLWLEDVPKTVEELIYFAEEDAYFSVKLVSQLHDFADILEDKSYNVKGIVLDIMLYRAYDLSALNIEGVDTDMGYEAGWRVLEHYLRAPNSTFKNIPVLIFSARSKKKEDIELLRHLNKQAGAPIEFIGKRESSDPDAENWNQKFKDWIKKVDGGEYETN